MRFSRGWLSASIITFTLSVAVVIATGVKAQAARTPFSLSDALVIDGATQLAPEQQIAAARARRANPEAALARERSATAYRRLGAAASHGLAARWFPRLVDAREGGPPQLPKGERVIGYSGPFAAQIGGVASNEHALVLASTPMAIRGSKGSWSAVNLGLREADGGFEGVNPLVGARLPVRLDEGARLTGIGLSVTPVDEHGSPLHGFPSVNDGASVFDADTLPSSDTVLKLSPLGLTVDTVLRSASSPQRLRFRVGLPAGARLTGGRGSGGALRVVRGGMTIATMPAPTAADSAGTPVPVSVRTTGDIVTLIVAHRAASYLYPIAVDPEFNVTTGGLEPNPAAWLFTHEGALEPKLPMVISPGPGLAAGNWGAYNYKTNGDSKLYEINTTVELPGAQGNLNGEYWPTSGEGFLQLYGTESEDYSVMFQENVHLTESWRKVKARACPHNSCTPESGAAGNTASVGMRATAAGAEQLHVIERSVAIAQPKETHSTISYNKAESRIGYYSGGKWVETPNVFSSRKFYYEEWLGPNSGAFEFTAEDAGLGLAGTEVDVQVAGKWTRVAEHQYLGTSSCVDVQCAKSQKEVLTYQSLANGGGLPDGLDTMRVSAHDAMSGTWSSEHGEGEAQLKVDATAPHGIVLSGLPSKSGEYEIDETTVPVEVQASDGEGTTQSSGISFLAVYVDGREVGRTGLCYPGPCTKTYKWLLNGGEIGAGRHVVTAVATDNAGNTAEREFLVNVYGASAVSMGPGSVNPESGNFELDSTDVNMSGGTGSLEVSRSFDSRAPQGGAGGPLGPQWQIGLHSTASLEVLPDGSVLVNGPEGFTHFMKAGGAFQPPPGDSNLKLETVLESGKVIAYLLKNPAKGATTRFTLPSGAQTWMPTVSEGPSATDSTTEEYISAEPEAGRKIVEPILEVAPHPSATCAYKNLTKGCRALEFNYATSTTATGENETQWGDHKGDLTRVYFIAWDPVRKEMTTTTVAQYAYDSKGRLRAEWDPRISPALKTTYGYDSEGHVTAVDPPGKQPWLLRYGPMGEDPSEGRLLSVTRPSASTELSSAPAPENPREGLAGSLVKEPYGVAVDSSGDVWVADTGHNRVQEYSRTGEFLREFGSEGSGGGQFKSPRGIAVDGEGHVWVADTGNYRIQEFSSTGTHIATYSEFYEYNPEYVECLTWELTEEECDEYVGGNKAVSHTGAFSAPEAVAVDSSGDIYVVDTGNDRVLEARPDGEVLLSFGSFGTGNGKFSSPSGIAVAASGEMWVLDKSGGGRLQEFSSSGSFLRSVSAKGSGIAVDSGGNVWTVGTNLSEYSSTGALLNTYGSQGTGNGQFEAANGIAVGPEGNLWVADTHNNRVQQLSSRGVYLGQVGTEDTRPPRLSTSTPTIGETVSVTKGEWTNSPLLYSFQWLRCSASGTECKPIEGAVNQTYTPVIADKHLTLQAEVRAGNGSGTTAALSAVSGAVAAQPAMVYHSQFGSPGSGNGQFAEPAAVAVDSAGDVWVADTKNNRVQEFSASGEYLRQFGSAGTGEGQLKEPAGVAVDAAGHVWVADTGNNRIQEFTSTGSHLATFKEFYELNPEFIECTTAWGMSEAECDEYFAESKLGAGKGAFSAPKGIATDSHGDVYVVDSGNNRVQVAEPDGGGLLKQVGSTGSGSGQLKAPSAVVVGAEGEMWVADTGNARLEEFSSSGTVMNTVAVSGLAGVGGDGNGELWALGASQLSEYDAASGALRARYGSEGSGNGQFKSPLGVVGGGERLWIADTKNDRIEEFTPLAASGAPAPPEVGSSATTTIEYRVPVAGAGAPYEMGPSEVSKWAQADVPATAAAVFPPDSVQGWPAASYKRATVYYLDAHANVTNVASPGGGISTHEYNEYGDETRSLSVANRAKALEEGAKSAEVAKLLDRQSVYDEEGRRLVETLGPQHTVKIAHGSVKTPTGSETLAREHVEYYYDEGAPENGEEYELVTKVTDGAQTAGEELDVRTTTTSYSGQSGLGWKLREPTSTTADPSGLKITHATLYDESTDAMVETRGPASGGAEDPHDEQTIYYTANANSAHPECGEHIEWTGLVCETRPGKQPEGGLSPLPVTVTTYNRWDQAETVTETFGTTTRTRHTSFDAAGRPLTTEVTSTNDTALPAVTDSYDEKTGALVKESETFEGKERAISSQYNRLGQLEAYTDADGGLTSYRWDVDGRVTEVSTFAPGMVERGKQTYSYDSTSGLVTKLVDSAAGEFKASYDAAGRLTSESYPNKMSAAYTYNAVGQSTGIEYSKTAYCASSCPERWFADAIVPSIHGEALKQTSTLAEEPNEVYDAVGRLTEVQEIPVGQGCTTRVYAYDAESNRTSLTTRAPGTGGACATGGGSSETHTYDGANRLEDSGVSYEAFGNITKLPAGDSGGAEVKSTYYVDNQLASAEQSGKTVSYYMDPAGRVRESRTPGVSVVHYAGPGSTVAWASEPESKWTRNIVGIDGLLTATQTNTGAVTLLLHDLQGNVVETAALDEKQTKVLTTHNSSEFGVPSGGAPPKYGWLGAGGVTSESATGLVVQNGVTYVPQVGKSLQSESVVLPRPSNMAESFEMEIAPWVVEGTAAMAKQLTAAEEAREKAEREAAFQAGYEAGGEDPSMYYNQKKALEVGEKLKSVKEWGEVWDTVFGLLGLADPVEWVEGAIVGMVSVDLMQEWLHNTAGKLEQCGKNKEKWVVGCELRYSSFEGAVDFFVTSEVEKCGLYVWYQKFMAKEAWECRRLNQSPGPA